MTTDYYAQARALAAGLADAGLQAWADRLLNVITAGSTGTEILMGLRWTLIELKSSEQPLPSDLHHQAARLLKDMNTAL